MTDRSAASGVAAAGGTASDVRLIFQWAQSNAGVTLAVFACAVLRAFGGACCNCAPTASGGGGGSALDASIRSALAVVSVRRGIVEISAALGGMGFEVAEYGGSGTAVLLCELAMSHNRECACCGSARCCPKSNQNVLTINAAASHAPGADGRMAAASAEADPRSGVAAACAAVLSVVQAPRATTQSPQLAVWTVAARYFWVCAHGHRSVGRIDSVLELLDLCRGVLECMSSQFGGAEFGDVAIRLPHFADVHAASISAFRLDCSGMALVQVCCMMCVGFRGGGGKQRACSMRCSVRAPSRLSHAPVARLPRRLVVIQAYGVPPWRRRMIS